MPADFIQLAKGYRSLIIPTSNYLLPGNSDTNSITVFSKGEHISSPRVIEAYSHKILELLEESGRERTSFARSLANFIGSDRHSVFKKEVNPRDFTEIIELENLSSTYHFLPKSAYSAFSILEEVGLLNYMRIKNPKFDVSSWLMSDNEYNRQLMRLSIDDSRVQGIDGQRYPEDHHCLIYKDLPRNLSQIVGLDEKDVEKVQRDFSPMALSALCVLTPSYS